MGLSQTFVNAKREDFQLTGFALGHQFLYQSGRSVHIGANDHSDLADRNILSRSDFVVVEGIEQTVEQAMFAVAKK